MPETPRRVVGVTDQALSVDAAIAAVADPAAGATTVFIGTVRNHSDAGVVTGLTYESWDSMAERRLAELADDLHARWTLCRVAIWHRSGHLAVGEASVVIAVSAPHRAAAFDACRHAIEQLKTDVPIWKKESLAEGEAHWIMGA